MNTTRTKLAGLVAASLVAAPLCGQFNFAPTVNTAAGPQPGGVAIADLDGDGDLDVATGIQFTDRVAIMTNDGITCEQALKNALAEIKERKAIIAGLTSENVRLRADVKAGKRLRLTMRDALAAELANTVDRWREQFTEDGV